MKKINSLTELVALPPFTKIICENKKEHKVNEYYFLYGKNDTHYYLSQYFYVTDEDKNAPIELFLSDYYLAVYYDYTKDELKELKDTYSKKHSLKSKLQKLKDYHWGYVNGKITFFIARPDTLRLEGFENKDADYSVDDIKSVCFDDPKFEDVEEILPKIDERLMKQCDIKKIKGRDIHSKCDFAFTCWHYDYIKFDKETYYNVYNRTHDDSEGYNHTYTFYVESIK